MTNTITENLDQLNALSELLSQLPPDQFTMEQGRTGWVVESPDHELQLQYLTEYTDARGGFADLNYPLLTLTGGLESTQELWEAARWLTELLTELHSETTNNDACGYTLGIDFRSAPENCTINVTIADYLS